MIQFTVIFFFFFGIYFFNFLNFWDNWLTCNLSILNLHIQYTWNLLIRKGAILIFWSVSYIIYKFLGSCIQNVALSLDLQYSHLLYHNFFVCLASFLFWLGVATVSWILISFGLLGGGLLVSWSYINGKS